MRKLDNCRKKIDVIDRGIVRLFLLRFRLVNQIANHKKINKIRIADKKRESDVLGSIRKSGKNHSEFLASIFKKTINYSKKLQK